MQSSRLICDGIAVVPVYLLTFLLSHTLPPKHDVCHLSPSERMLVVITKTLSLNVYCVLLDNISRAGVFVFQSFPFPTNNCGFSSSSQVIQLR